MYYTYVKMIRDSFFSFFLIIQELRQKHTILRHFNFRSLTEHSWQCHSMFCLFYYIVTIKKYHPEWFEFAPVKQITNCGILSKSQIWYSFILQYFEFILGTKDMVMKRQRKVSALLETIFWWGRSVVIKYNYKIILDS